MKKTNRPFQLYVKVGHEYKELGLYCTYGEMYGDMKSEAGYTKSQVVRMLKSGKMKIVPLDKPKKVKRLDGKNWVCTPFFDYDKYEGRA